MRSIELFYATLIFFNSSYSAEIFALWKYVCPIPSFWPTLRDAGVGVLLQVLQHLHACHNQTWAIGRYAITHVLNCVIHSSYYCSAPIRLPRPEGARVIHQKGKGPPAQKSHWTSRFFLLEDGSRHRASGGVLDKSTGTSWSDKFQIVSKRGRNG